eukprot:3898786-Rhodomonas_salina.2
MHIRWHSSLRSSMHPLLRTTFCLLLACTASYHTASASTKECPPSAFGGPAFVRPSIARKSAGFSSGSCDQQHRAANIFTLRPTQTRTCRPLALECSAASDATVDGHTDDLESNCFSKRRHVSRQIVSSVLGLAAAAASNVVSAEEEEGPPPKTGRCFFYTDFSSRMLRVFTPVFV